MGVQSFVHAAALALRGKEDGYAADDQQRCGQTRQPPRLEIVKQRVEAKAHADCGQSRPHPAGKGALIGHDRTVFRIISTVAR